MKVSKPIITSLIDDDFYKYSMGQIVFFHFSDAQCEWEFINRGKTEFPEDFAEELQHQVNLLSDLKLEDDEYLFFKSLPYMKTVYLDWLRGFRMNPKEVKITQIGGALSITIKGPWHRVIFWEVKLMAIISELYFILTGARPDQDTFKRMSDKAAQLSACGCVWSDFGTRRRFSFQIQDDLVGTMKRYNGFAGTSNPFLAKKYNVPVKGTSAHEAQMAMSAKYGVEQANIRWLEHWSDFYRGQLGIALTDTYTTDVFLRDFDGYMARLFDGLRHDSADPIAWGEKILAHYQKLGINPINKQLVFSDGLTVEKYIKIHEHFCSRAKPVAGIGTHLTNDCGATPLNIVIKMVAANFGNGWKPVVKLSDNPGKHTGNDSAIITTKQLLGI